MDPPISPDEDVDYYQNRGHFCRLSTRNILAGVACLERDESFPPTNAKAFTHCRAGYTHVHP